MGDGFWILVGSVALYSSVPIAAALRPGRLRFILFYAYIAVLLVLGGLLGSIYVLPVWGDIEISAGHVAYGGFIFATLIATIVGREVRVIRNVIVMLFMINAVVYVHFMLSSRAMETAGVINPFATSPDVFEQQLRTVVTGGVLSVMELLVLFRVLEAAKRRLGSAWMVPVYVAGFITVLLVDGALFGPLLAVPDLADLGSMIWTGVQAKAVLAAAFCVPLVFFLLVFRSTIRRFERAALEWPVLFFSGTHELRATTGWRPRSPASDRRAGDRRADSRVSEPVVEVARELSLVDSTVEIDLVLDQLTSILEQLPGVRSTPVVLAVRVDGQATSVFGTAIATRTSRDAPFPQRAFDGEVWNEPASFDAGLTAFVPIIVDESTAAVLEVGLEQGQSVQGEQHLRSVAMHLTSLLGPCVRRISELWTIRKPIVELIEHRALDIVFQPVVDLTTRRVVSAEALSRFDDQTSPSDRFIEAERAGLLAELELLAFEETLRAVRDLPSDLRVAINLSPSVLLEPRLGELLETVDRTIVVEITERHVVEDYDALKQCIASHSNLRLAVDDAGSGYATLAHVLQMKPDYIKLDRAWVTGIQHDRPRQVLVSGLRALAEEIDADIIAEGVETPEEIATLEDLGIRLGQGFLLGRPIPAAELTYA